MNVLFGLYHQGRFAGPVFPEQRVNLAPSDNEVTPSFAMTPGNRLTIPRITIAGGAFSSRPADDNAEDDPFGWRRLSDLVVMICPLYGKGRT